MRRKPASMWEAMWVFWKARMFGRVCKGIRPLNSDIDLADDTKGHRSPRRRTSLRGSNPRVWEGESPLTALNFVYIHSEALILSSHVISLTFDWSTGVYTRVLGRAESQGNFFVVISDIARAHALLK